MRVRRLDPFGFLWPIVPIMGLCLGHDRDLDFPDIRLDVD